MPSRDPHAVLGVDRDASAATIKAAWRRLAREHHPDVASADPAAVRRATRRMAEINAAYEQLRAGSRNPGAASPRFDREATSSDRTTASGESRRRGGGPPPPPRARPVTGRVDTSTTFRPRNSTISGGPSVPRGVRVPFPGRSRRPQDPLRASNPTGPVERGRVRNFRRPARPTLERARDHVLEFGKFRGHTLGEVAAFEPAYIDWLARTISRDPELTAAARVIQDELDRAGVARRDRPAGSQAEERRSAV
ncbi:MAG TPA: DnaJ domain-containing protein [Candidatus Limnocylindrales bacterium]